MNPEDGSLSGCISLGPLGEIPFIARKPTYGGNDDQYNMIVAADKTPIGMIKTLLGALAPSEPFKKRQFTKQAETKPESIETGAPV